MANDRRSIPMFLITLAIALAGTAASAQSRETGSPDPFHKDTRAHVHQMSDDHESIAAHLKFGMMRAAAIDDDLKALADDMNMFTGEMKIQVMAQVVTLLVERLSIMREQMMAMHELMMGTTGPVWNPSETSRPTGRAADEVEPGAMCLELPF